MNNYNLVIITPDQLRADYLGCYGHPDISTKNIDKLAQQGIVFDNCYCAAPLCAPSRISFATSTYFSEHNHRNYGSEISPQVPNLVKSLKQAGYTTGMFGKNHLFTYERLHEVWDELDEICLGNYDGHPDYHHSFSSFTMDPEHPYNITGRLTNEAIDFMKQSSEKPFFMWLNYQDPHPAYTCPSPYDTMFDWKTIQLSEAYKQYNASGQPVRNEVWRAHSEMDICTAEDLKRAIAHYMGQIRYVDDCVGKVTEYLENSGLEKNTIVLFFSDHGELLGDYGMMHKLPVFYDCLTKIPVILRYPHGYEGERFGGLVEEVDLTPTLLSIMDLPIPSTMVGRTLKNSLDNKDYTGRTSVLCEAGGGAPTCTAPLEGLKLLAPHIPTSFGPGAMIRKDNFKLSIYYDDSGELYDLSNDPHELKNLYKDEDFAEIRNEFTLELFKRVIGVKVRDRSALHWDTGSYPIDVRFEPLE